MAQRSQSWQQFYDAMWARYMRNWVLSERLLRAYNPPGSSQVGPPQTRTPGTRKNTTSSPTPPARGPAPDQSTSSGMDQS